jgi:uncharacterized protein YcbX
VNLRTVERVKCSSALVRRLWPKQQPVVTIKQLLIYPVKSCTGINVESAELGRHGFVDDRDWMVVNASGVFQSQRDLPRLALVRLSYSDDMQHLRVNAPEMPELLIERKRPAESGVVACEQSVRNR